MLGRFISEDPLGFAAGDSNLYRYVGNNPALFTDPSGLQTASEKSLLGSIQTVAQQALCAALGAAAGAVVTAVLEGMVSGPLAAAAGGGAGTIVGGACLKLTPVPKPGASVPKPNPAPKPPPPPKPAPKPPPKPNPDDLTALREAVKKGEEPFEKWQQKFLEKMKQIANKGKPEDTGEFDLDFDF